MAGTGTTTDGPTDRTAQAALRLQQARATRTPCAPVRDLIGPTDIAAAYAVQEQLTAQRVAGGATVVGRKIGLTAPAVQAQLGVDTPDFGVLFADMDASATATIPAGQLLQPRVEAEVAFVLAADLVDGDFGAQQIRESVDYAVAALEIVDSRIASWDITIADTVADNASSGMFVLGAQRADLTQVTPVCVEMEMTRNDQVVSTGDGAACLGDPLNALAWLARVAREHGAPLRAGQVVLSGALGPVAPAADGDRFTATISGLGDVSVTFGSHPTP